MVLCSVRYGGVVSTPQSTSPNVPEPISDKKLESGMEHGIRDHDQDWLQHVQKLQMIEISCMFSVV